MTDWKTEIIGPVWPKYVLSVGGFRVPHLSISPPMDADKNHAPLENDRIFLVCDERTGVYTTREELDRWLPFIADCMAVAAGYPCHGAKEKMTPFAVKMTELGDIAPEKPNLTIVDSDKQPS